jgi:hypothetical protein
MNITKKKDANGNIDNTPWHECKCQYCSVWTPEVIACYEKYLLEEELNDWVIVNDS